tara:strand:+ start:1581 stop:2060 length:480 start_codon:yes stop_codon:yes gene_type:complete
MEYDSAKIPKLFKTVRWRSYTVNLDVGGGDQEDATLYLAEHGVTNVVYDPAHRDSDHNYSAITFVMRRGGSNSVTISNVLNLYPSWKDRDAILYYSKFLARTGAPVYIGVCEGNKSGVGEHTSYGWQANLELGEYADAIANRFKIIKISSDMITALKAD